MMAGLPVRSTHVQSELRRRQGNGSAFWIVGAALLLSACGGDSGSDSSSAGEQPPPVQSPGDGNNNTPPTISGTPPTTVMASSPYLFTPTASDGDGDVLTFRIENQPRWATFSTSTGRLEGTPTAADIGTYSNVSISVTDGEATSSLASFTINVVATATGTATLTWQAPFQNTDGSALTNLAGFKVYWGTNQGSYSNSAQVGPGSLSYVVENLTPATWYFAVSVLNSNGVESRLSNPVSKTIR